MKNKKFPYLFGYQLPITWQEVVLTFLAHDLDFSTNIWNWKMILQKKYL